MGICALERQDIALRTHASLCPVVQSTVNTAKRNHLPVMVQQCVWIILLQRHRLRHVRFGHFGR